MLAGEARYTITDNHYDCEFPDGYKSSPREQFDELDKKVGAIFDSFGIKRMRLQASLGSGGPTRRLTGLIEASAKDHFDTQNIGEIKFHLAPPVWRQPRFDVQRFEGSMRVDCKLVLFG